MTNFNASYSMTIAGKAVMSDMTFSAVNPATGASIAEVPDATREQPDQAVAAATQAFSSWRSSSYEQRKQALESIATVLEEHAEDFMSLLTKEQGKPRAGGAMGDRRLGHLVP